MRKLFCQVVLGSSLSMIVTFCGQELARSADINKVSSPPPDNCIDTKYKQGRQASESFRLYYQRSAATIQTILKEIAEANPCIKGTLIEAPSENLIVLYGFQKQREDLERIIATLDLPRERVNLEMWGIVISSNSPKDLAKVMRKVNQEIDQTEKLMQATYKTLEQFAREISDDDIDPEYRSLLEKTLGYQTALDKDRPSLSMMDILLRINAAKDPIANNNGAAKKLCQLFQGDEYKPYVEALKLENKVPFENYLIGGLLQEKSSHSDPNFEGSIKNGDKRVLLESLYKRIAVLNFALQYSNLADNPDSFDPNSLQESAESLNAVLNPLVSAINRDVEDLFIEPTLANIQNIVRQEKNVDYAEVGKTSVAGLNGLPSVVSSKSVSSFEVTPPLNVAELLNGQLTPGVNPFNNVPVSSLVNLAAGLSKDRTSWQQLTSGITLSITPSVLRNSASAELKIDLTTGPDPKDTATESKQISRIVQNDVNTTVYVNTLDIFALSTFNSQTTINGDRTYIPIIGTILQGIFSDIPVIGNLFSWKNNPKNVQHQSIVLTNSFIVPTAMGLAPLYQKRVEQEDFYHRCLEVEKYISGLKDNVNGKKPTYVFSQPISPEDEKSLATSVCAE